jgi:predicted acylesterase/phospholipase RssA
MKNKNTKNHFLAPRKMRIVVAPASGALFPNQLGLYSELYRARLINAKGKFESSKEYIPDIVIGASGGNISTYIALGGDWTDAGIERVSNEVNSTLFARSWFPTCMYIIPTWVIGIFKGALYRPSNGIEALMETMLCKNKLDNVEIWSGTYNCNTAMPEMFCNLEAGKTRIWPSTYNPLNYHTMPLHFLSGNICTISKAIAASASIPYVFEKTIIGSSEYCDGGVGFQSPIIPFQDEIYKICTGDTRPDSSVPNPPSIQGLSRKEEPMHLIYLSSNNMEDHTATKASFVPSPLVPISNLIASNFISDRAAAINILSRIAARGENVKNSNPISFEKHELLDTATLATILDKNKDRNYVLYLYVNVTDTMELGGFTGSGILKMIRSSVKNYGAYLWSCDFRPSSVSD